MFMQFTNTSPVDYIITIIHLTLPGLPITGLLQFHFTLYHFVFQDAMPLRLKEVHIVRQPFIFNIIWNLFKPFMKEKLKKRVNVAFLSTYW